MVLSLKISKASEKIMVYIGHITTVGTLVEFEKRI